MASIRTTVTLDEELSERAHRLKINISAAARQGITDAVRSALLRSDREAYQRFPEPADRFWEAADAWGDE